ncbi:hypothetical protein TRFO_35838 [Tritrichomonas foetus]|uniref:Uncharacterized protein n=1 Tax=Tritrichomonas foetus TaxID=1144522 RepID=A0A1J4JFF2_9EUKA|nr:hypothetical protein TRFO_35838 [Tritrichomonas foetus]|eukprot:OHS97874.1 hypothetical protein TRFO_35838 [Tritrichomonas foetus]
MGRTTAGVAAKPGRRQRERTPVHREEFQPRGKAPEAEDPKIVELIQLTNELETALRERYPDPEDQKYLGIYQEESRRK